MSAEWRRAAGTNRIMKVTYSHAAPMIRSRMCLCASNADSAGTLRDRNAYLNQLDGLRSALVILGRSDDTRMHVASGIAEEESLPAGAVALARHALGPRTAEELFGPEERRRCGAAHKSRWRSQCAHWAVDGSQYCELHNEGKGVH